jgi:hypothetical protein
MAVMVQILVLILGRQVAAVLGLLGMVVQVAVGVLWVQLLVPLLLMEIIPSPYLTSVYILVVLVVLFLEVEAVQQEPQTQCIPYGF